MGCKICKTEPYEPQINDKKTRRRRRHGRNHRKGKKHRHRQPKPEPVEVEESSHDDSISSQPESISKNSIGDDTVSETSVIVDEFVDIEVADLEAFNQNVNQQRQQAINNTSYRSNIESWEPTSLKQLAGFIKALAKGKSLIDRHWIIFYWIAFNIEYDAVSYFAKDYKDQTAEGVFRTRKGVCAGYANIYKYLCDELQMPCEVIGGYSKGYGFDDREGAPTETDHAWNAVEIYSHWYLMESTWGAGHLNKQKAFERKLETYYFLPRPNEMIYHHLPEDKKWQLLKTPIKMAQYLQVPHLRPDYFAYNLEIIQPRNQHFVNLEQNKPFALVIMKSPTDVHLMADLQLHDKKIDGGHQVIFDKRKRLYYCYFAPRNIGKHKVTIYAKRGNSDLGTYSSALDLTFNIKNIPENPISYPTTWKCYFDFRMKILSPLRTHLINLNNDEKFTQILIQTPPDIQLTGQLKNNKDETVPCGARVYYDGQKDFWRCKFAPNKKGLFDAIIMAKKKTDPGSYTSAVSFKINADQISSPPLSFPNTWPLFYDLDLKVIFPVGRGIIVLREKTSMVEIRIKAPDDVQLLGQLQDDKGEVISRGDQVYYDKENDWWRCKFEPNRNGIFEAMIMAKKKSTAGSYTSAVSFRIEAKQLSSKTSALLNTTQLYHDLDLKVLSPLDGSTIVLREKSSYAEICLKTPDDVQLLGRLIDINKEEVPNADQVYYDRHKGIWRCKFAPNQNGLFDARIMAKKKSDSDSYFTVVTFQIEANHIHKPPLTFPRTSQLFYDFDLKIEAPRSRATAVWSENAAYTEILIQAPDDIQLSSSIEYKNSKVENGALTQFDNEKQLWQFLFAPERTGPHDLIIFAKRNNDSENPYNTVVTFHLNVTKLGQRMKFPEIFTKFEATKCRLYTPMHGILKKGSTVPIHCVIPGAISVILTVDAKNLKPEGYNDPILQREITVGSEEVTIHAKYGQTPHYISLIKYSVE